MGSSYFFAEPKITLHKLNLFRGIKMLIYKATLPNGKSYIGLTIKTIEERKIEHRCVSKNQCNYYFHRAIRKYGWENIKWEILEDDINDFEYLKERETFNILKYDTFMPNGYNMTLGGEGTFGWKPTKETREKIRKNALQRFKNIKNHPMFGVTANEKTRNKMSISQLKRFENEYSHNFKKHLSQITKQKISISKKGKRTGSQNSMWKYYYFFISKNGEEYKNFTNLKDFCIKNKINPLHLVTFYWNKKKYKDWIINRSRSKFE